MSQPAGNLSPPYLETIRQPSEGESKLIRNTRSGLEYAHIEVMLEPLPRGRGCRVVEKAAQLGAIPARYLPAIRSGFSDAIQSGFLFGLQLTDIKITLMNASYHEQDSTDLAFHDVAVLAFREAMQSATRVVLEPIMQLQLFVAEDYVGGVMGAITARRGTIEDLTVSNPKCVIRVTIPFAELNYLSEWMRLNTGEKAEVGSALLLRYEETPDFEPPEMPMPEYT